MRHLPRISEVRLRFNLKKHYDVTPATLELLPLGLDYRSAVYRVVSVQGTAYLLKVTSRPLYKPQYLIPRFLHNQGITGVVAPISTKSGALWTRIDNWTIVVYPFIIGDSSFNGMSAEQWKKMGTILRRIHQIALPPQEFKSIRRETFDSTVYVQGIRAIEDQLTRFEGGSTLENTLHASWVAHRLTIHDKLTSLEKLARSLKSQTRPLVICHADLHPANLIRNPGGQVFVIDWDEVMLAPKERDFIFVSHPHDFFQGYGAVEVDETVLTYYRLERVLQDLIECARNVCFRDDLGEATKADAMKLFQNILAEEAAGEP
ncbi:spectinomycin phosphotransferase [Paenibacillus sp. UNC496MF]|nr:spectinomycin phosphotransferase [Paenibacillus sp. UNC496MF]